MLALYRFLKPSNAGSIPVRPTRLWTALRRRTQSYPQVPPQGGTAMQAKCCGDTSVRHAEIDGFNSLRLLAMLAVAAPSAPARATRGRGNRRHTHVPRFARPCGEPTPSACSIQRPMTERL